jgi:hypothetical protein
LRPVCSPTWWEGLSIGLLWLSVCFRPPALLLALLFGAVNLVGLAALGDEIGLRANARLGARPAASSALPFGILLLRARRLPFSGFSAVVLAFLPRWRLCW